MVTQVKPTKKNSPDIHRGANRDNKPAESYAKPHSQLGPEGYSVKQNGYDGDNHDNGNDVPMSVGAFRSKPYPTPKSDGITMRGYGAAIKGIKSRGPMA
jgi:hypothetical protein